MAADYQLSLRDYLSIARRRALLIVLTFGAVVAASVVVAMVLPRVYQSTGTLLVESPHVSGDVVNAALPGNVEQRVQALSQRIMTRESLLRIAAEHQVFDPKSGVVMKDTDVANAMRASIEVHVQNGGLQNGERPTGNFAFNVSFQHGEPKKALEVTNALLRLFLESSVRERVEKASQANQFLSQEADRVKAQLEELERRIETYKRTQGSATEDGQAVALANIQTLESDLRATERDHRLALDQLQTLTVELAGARAGVLMPGTVTAPGPSIAEQDLERARSELARIRGVYTEDHPDVLAQRRKIELLERSLRSDSSASSPARDAAAAQAKLAVSRLEAQLSTARARADLLANQQASLRNAINLQRSRVTRAPQVERDLAALQRDHDAAQAKYEDLRSKQMSAQVVQNLEGGQQGERFTLLEPALMPEYPIKPSRKKVVALGFFLALAAAAGVVVLLEVIFARVRGVNSLTAVTGLRPMVVIPYITTASELHATQVLRIRLIALSAGLVLLGLVLIHTLVVPLHTLLISVFSRLD
ncbi:GumC family protein [Hydrogenophaga sp. RWCD_12]|uniref:GumC family protein n=1 Tax=Hydrogenophaga sp. RWCD_12 TaxID=3391190 RepID=UPI0039853E01